MQNIYSSINDLLQLVSNSRNAELNDFIDRETDIDLSSVRDSKCNSLLHIAAYNINYEALRLLLYQQSLRNNNLSKWIDSVNSEGLTALHISCFKGSLKISQYLVDHGANYHIKSSSGQLPVHTSAQGDSPALLLYFKQKGINLNIPDERGSTPLHWAAYAGAENTVNYLLAFKCEMNIQDTCLGYTPLHLAALQGYTRVVRKLLVRGADRNIKSFKGKTPLDIAIDNEYKHMSKMLIDKMGIQEYLNIKQPYHPVYKTYKSVMFLVIFYFLWNISVLWSEFIFLQEDPKILFYIQGILSLCTYIILITLVFSNTGVRRTKIDILKALEEFEPQRICPDCEIIKPLRSRHCEICQQCCIVYDHHCPWVNNCIGANNFKYFYLFLISLLLSAVIGFIALTLSKYYQIINSKNIYTDPLFISFVICLTLGFLILIPLICLFIVQTRNLFEGITTFERFTYNAKQAFGSIVSKNANDKNRNNSNIQTNIPDSHIPLSKSNYSNLIDESIDKKPGCCANILDMCYRNSKKFGETSQIYTGQNILHIQEDQISLY